MNASDWLLAFDCSTPVPAIALGRLSERGDELLATDELQIGANEASVVLLQRIEALLVGVGIAPGELGALACGRGPGTFTGSRVAAATAKGLAVGLEIGVHPVSTLAAVAASCDEPLVLALLDARRGEVYAGLFGRTPSGPEARGEEVCVAPGLLGSVGGEPAGASPFVYGPGVEPSLAALPPELRARALPGNLRAAGLWRAAVAERRRGPALPPEELAVTYLRQSYAEMGIHPPRRGVGKSPFV